MSKTYASGKHAFGICDRCGFRYPYRSLRKETINETRVNLKVCPDCFDDDHPQLRINKLDPTDPQTLRDPRPQTDLAASRSGLSASYEFNTSVESWDGNDSTLVWQTGGTALMTGTGDDPFIFITGLSLDASSHKALEVSFRITTKPTPLLAGRWRFYWARSSDSGNFSNDRSVSIPGPYLHGPSGVWETGYWHVYNHSLWTGTIESLRVDFFNFAGLARTVDPVIEIDYIRLLQRPSDTSEI